MKTSLKFILVVVLSAIFVTSCSRKKDRFISRNYHAVAAEYNALYNGYLALDEGRQSLNDAYSDNYWDILPIERMQIIDEIILPGQSKNENFNRAEEKAVVFGKYSSARVLGSGEFGVAHLVTDETGKQWVLKTQVCEDDDAVNEAQKEIIALAGFMRQRGEADACLNRLFANLDLLSFKK